MTGDWHRCCTKQATCLLLYQMTATLACKSNEAALNLGIVMCILQSMSVCAKSCMGVLVPGDGTIFSTCTLCEGNTPRTQSILGANGVIVRQEWLMPNKAWRRQTSSPFHNQILAFLSLQPGWSPVERQRRGSSPATPTQSMNLKTWVLLHLPPPELCTPSLVHSDKTMPS